MNLADLASVFTFFGCIVAAGVGAAWQRAGWYCVLFAMGGGLLGVLALLMVSASAYTLLHLATRRSALAVVVFGILYMSIPMLLASALILLTGLVSAGCAKHWFGPIL